MLESSSEYKFIKYFIIIACILYIIQFTSVLYYISSYSSEDIIKRLFYDKTTDDIDIKPGDIMFHNFLKKDNIINIDKNDINQIKEKINKYKIILSVKSILSILLSILFLVYILNYKNLSIKTRSMIKKILLLFLILSIIMNTGILLFRNIYEIANIVIYLFIIAFLNSK